MQAITSLLINNVEMGFNAQFISDILFFQGIAAVSKITLIPNFEKPGYMQAYADIAEWQDTEAAFNFIMRLRSSKHQAKLIYYDENAWTVTINDCPEITSLPRWASLTTHFAVLKDDLIEEEEQQMNIIEDEISNAKAAEEAALWTELETLIDEAREIESKALSNSFQLTLEAPETLLADDSDDNSGAYTPVPEGITHIKRWGIMY